MSQGVVIALVALGLGPVAVRRRSVGIALLAAQSLLLGAVALGDELSAGAVSAGAVSTGAAASGAATVAAVGLLARGVALPLVLAAVVVRTRETRPVASERFALGRVVAVLAVVVAAVALTPALGLGDPGGADVGRGAVALVVLGIATAAARRPVLFHVIGLLMAENGVYLATRGVHGALPGVVELALLADLIAVVGVLAVVGSGIHARFGSGDARLLEALRD